MQTLLCLAPEADLSVLGGLDGVEAVRARDATAARMLLSARHVDLLLLGSFDAGSEDLFVELRRDAPELPVLVLADPGRAPDAVRLGARRVLTRPLRPDDLRGEIRYLLGSTGARGRLEARRAALESWPLLGQSPAMRALQEGIDGAAASSIAVVISGEPGVGKQTVAHRIHACSPRAERPLAKVSCPGLAADVSGRRIFEALAARRDHRGWLEIADGGTLLLDEVGELDFGLQATLFRVLQEVSRTAPSRGPAPPGVRVIATTSSDLAALATEGAFRLELLHFLTGVTLQVAPLRSRPGDIELLARAFVDRACAALDRRPPAVAPAALEQLRRHPFPGNVSELLQAVDRTLLLEPGPMLSRFHLLPVAGSGELKGGLAAVKRELLRRHLESRLRALGGSRPALARELRVHPNNLYRLLRSVGASRNG